MAVIPTTTCVAIPGAAHIKLWDLDIESKGNKERKPHRIRALEAAEIARNILEIGRCA